MQKFIVYKMYFSVIYNSSLRVILIKYAYVNGTLTF